MGALFGSVVGFVYWGGRTPELENETMTTSWPARVRARRRGIPAPTTGVAERRTGPVPPSLTPTGGPARPEATTDPRSTRPSPLPQCSSSTGHGQRQIGEPVEQGAERDLGFGAGEGRTEAVVDAVAEGQVGGVVPERGRASAASPYRSRSRLAAARQMITWAPAGMVASPSVTGSVA